MIYAMKAVRGVAAYKATPPLFSGSYMYARYMWLPVVESESMIDKSPAAVKQKRR